jgi:hypothetical protein
MPAAFFVVRATVTDPAKREAFGTWYSREHLPDAMKSFGAVKAWRYWSATDPSLHHAMYQFADKTALERATEGPENEASGRRLQPRLARRNADARGVGAGGGTRGVTRCRSDKATRPAQLMERSRIVTRVRDAEIAQ